MKLIGAHLSISKGIDKLQEQMDLIGIKTCALFLKNQKRFYSPPLNEEKIRSFKEKVVAPELLLPHGSYLINLANPKTIDRSYSCLTDDMKRCSLLGIKFYNLHPGSDVGKLGSKCYRMIADSINKAHNEVPNVIVLLENMAGQGSVIGSKFEQLRDIIESVKNKDRVGVCLDTCHLFGAGYDIRTADKFSAVIDSFDSVVGLRYLRAMHLNDSKEPLGSRKDRHESLGKGLIGLDAFKFIMNNKTFEDMPMILETPNPDLYFREIQLLRSFENDDEGKAKEFCGRHYPSSAE